MLSRVGWAGAGGAISGMGMSGGKLAFDGVNQQIRQGQLGETDTQKTASTGEAENRLLSEQDLDEYLSVGERKHVRDLKEAQARTGNSPILTTMEQIKSFIRSALSGEVRDTIKGYGKIGTRMVEDLRAAGVDVDGYYLELDANRIGHLSDHVGDDGDQRNIPLTQEQAENITSYIDSYDDVLDVVRHTDGGVRITLGKKINGHAVVVELISKGRKSIQPVTAWLNDTEHYLRKYGQKETQAIDTSHSHEREESGYKQLASKTSIPQTTQDVNARLEARAQELERGIAEMDQQRLERGIEDLGTQGRATVKAMYLEGQDAGAYVQGMRELYAAGLAGVAMENVESEAVQSLNDHQRRAAYEAGQVDARAQVAKNKRRADFAKVAGKEKGLVWDSYVEQKVDPKVADRLNEVAKRLNVRVHFVDSILDGWANGQLVEADIRIAKDTKQPVMVVFGHEVGHYLETTAPEAYQAIRQFAAQHHMEEINALMELYAKAGQAQDLDGILKEYVNDEIGRMIEDGQALAAFIEANKQNRTLLQKVAEALRALWQKLTGKDRQQVKTAEEALLAALKASEAQAAKLEQAGQVMDFAQEGEGGKYLLKGRRADGIEVYETSQEVRALPWRERRQRFLDIMQEQYRGRTAKFVTRDGETYYAKFDNADIKKNIYGDKRSDSAGRDAKINVGADGDIFDLVENTTHKSSDIETGKPGVAHQDVTGWEYFVKTVQIDGHIFDLLANVRKKPNGEYVYSIQLNENKKMSASPVAVFAQGDPASEWGTTDNGSVLQPTEEVNGDFSLKGSEVLTQEVSQVMEQSRQEGWSQEQTQEEIRAAVQSTLQSLVDEYGSIKPGESPAREVQVPRRTGKHDKVSQTVRTILEAGATPETIVPSIEELTVKGEFSYQAVSDKTAVERAEQTMKYKGWGNSLADWIQTVKAGKVSKENTAMGWALYNHAANTGDIQTAMDILQRMVQHQRNAAQAVQATRILKQLSPEAQLYGAQRSVECLQAELNERYGDKKAPKLTIDEELARRLLEAGDQETRDGVLQDIYRDVGPRRTVRFRFHFVKS